MAINSLNTPSPRGLNGGRFYAFPSVPTLIDCQFTVSKTDSGGLGITNLKGMGVNTVFMNTSSTAGVGPNGVTNPLAQSASDGLIKLQLANSYGRVLSLDMQIASPTTGSNVAAGGSALTVGQAYTITVVGTTTAAEWLAIGLDPGVTPAVGCSLVALVTGSGSGSGQVKAVGVSGIIGLEMITQSSPIANPQLHPLATGGLSPNIGAIILAQFLGSAAGALTMNSYTPAGTNSKPTFTVKNGTILANGTMGLDADSAAANVVGGTGITADRTLTTTSPVGTPSFSGTPATLTGSVAAASTVITQPANGSIIYLSMIVSQR